MLPISVCLISKNEEARIEKCLSSMADYPFELVLVDTGSTDQTCKLAAKYTDKIYHFDWIDDFSAARNYSLEVASHDWILMMDCDEWIEHIDLDELAYFQKNLSNAVGSVDRRNVTGTPSCPGPITIDRTERFFNRKLYHYTGIIHEQLTPKKSANFETYLLKITIGHSGYCMSEDARASKSLRNIELLLKQLEKEPNNPYVMYQLGKGYQMIKDDAKACDYFAQALEYDLDPSLAYVQSLVVEYGYTLLSLKRLQEALLFEAIYDDFGQSADFVYLMGLIYLENQKYNEALHEFMKATDFEFANREGVNTYLAFFRIAHILYLAGEIDLCKSYLIKCGNYPPAIDLLQDLK